MFCTKCGAQLPQGVTTCPRCGAPAEGGQPAQSAQPTPQSTPQPQRAPAPDKAAEKARRAEEKARLAREKQAQRDAALAAREKEKARLAQEKQAQRNAAAAAKEKAKAAKSAQKAPAQTPQPQPVPAPQYAAPAQTAETERRISTGRLILLILAVVAIVVAAAVIAAVLLLGEPKGISHGGGGGGGPTQGLTERDLTPTERELFARVVEELPDTVESDLQDAYGAFPKGYTVETDIDDFSFIPTTDYNLFYLQGYFYVRDKAAGSSADPYRVDVTGMVSTEQTRQSYKTNLFVDCQEPGEQATSTEHYILPTDSRYITYDELYPLSKTEVTLARNEIYARYGYSFKDEDIRAYFEAQSWYTADPNVNASTFDPSVFNAYERANLATIIQFEKDNGWR